MVKYKEPVLRVSEKKSTQDRNRLTMTNNVRVPKLCWSMVPLKLNEAKGKKD